METNFNSLQGADSIRYSNNIQNDVKEETKKPPEQKSVEANSSDALGNMGAALVNMQKNKKMPDKNTKEIKDSCRTFLQTLDNKFSKSEIDSITKFISDDKDIAQAQAQVILNFSLSNDADSDSIRNIVIYMNNTPWENPDNPSEIMAVGNAKTAEMKKELALELLDNGNFSQRDIEWIISNTSKGNPQILEYQKDVALELSENERFDADIIGDIIHYMGGVHGDNSTESNETGSSGHAEDIVAIKKELVSELAKNPEIPGVDITSILAQNFYEVNDPENTREWAQEILSTYE